MMKINFSLSVGLCLSMGLSVAQASDEAFERAQQCTEITSRLDRLSCFDALFNTPANVLSNPLPHSDVPISWQRAFDSLNQYQTGDVSHLTTQGNSDKGNAWVTLMALNKNTGFAGNTKPVLLLSCIDNLSRVELAFPSAIDDPKVQISIVGMPAQSWRSDDLGLLFSSGRGMPAIAMMKAMAKQNRLVLRSNSPLVDGLWFDASNLSTLQTALQMRCGW
ncbi:type VI secretion system-associated protein TagO [Vibrio kasasachensis]|uniref:type VI secretion system-associated protein VasI n=1 Tax=Vibrio kasasachensis TaxID=2910248 RepID=UPI003D134B7A